MPIPIVKGVELPGRAQICFRGDKGDKTKL